MAAAYGGQIVAPMGTVEKIIAEWTQQPCPPMLENNRPIVTVKAKYKHTPPPPPPTFSPNTLQQYPDPLQAI